MLHRVAEAFGLKQQKDEAVSKRFAQLKTRFRPSSSSDQVDFVNRLRSGLDSQPVVGGRSDKKDFVRNTFLDNCTRVKQESELVGTGLGSVSRAGR